AAAAARTGSTSVSASGTRTACRRIAAPWRGVASRSRPRAPCGRIVHQTARAHRVEGDEAARLFHADAHRAVSAHRVAGKSTAFSRRDGAISLVDERRQILSDERLPVSDGRRVRKHTAAVLSEGIWYDHDHFAGA